MIFHGYVKTKVDDIFGVKKGEEGIITAYFPFGDDDPVVAVMFSEEKWITFKGWTEAQFLERFEVDREEVENVQRKWKRKTG